jgi:hypothetical protein
MYMPCPQVQGCRPYWETDNRACRKTVAIPLSSLPTHEAVAQFYSYLAYPEPIETTQRKKYTIALSRWAVLERSKFDKGWAENQLQIRPIIFSQPEKLFLDTRKLGTRILWKRIELAFLMLFPDLESGLFGGLPPNVGNTAQKAGEILGYGPGSTKNVEADIWAPVKTVVHAAATVRLYLDALKDPRQGWDEEHQLCARQPFLATFFHEDIFTNQLLGTAESLRLQVPNCERFDIAATDLISFMPDWIVEKQASSVRESDQT